MHSYLVAPNGSDGFQSKPSLVSTYPVLDGRTLDAFASAAFSRSRNFPSTERVHPPVATRRAINCDPRNSTGSTIFFPPASINGTPAINAGLPSARARTIDSCATR